MKYHFMILLFATFALVAFPGAAPAEAECGQPELTAQTAEEESSPEYLEQYEAWEKADQEADLLKRGAMLIEFTQKYPQSILLPHAESSYRKALRECNQKERYLELSTLADQRLERNPGDLETIAYAVRAAEKLGNAEKRIQYLEQIYELQPSGSLAIEIARACSKNKDNDKYIEWLGTAAAYPENASNFVLYYSIVQTHTEAQDYASAAENAYQTLKAADLVKDPSEDTKLQLRRVRNACHHLIGMNLMENKKYPEAIQAFRQALKAEKYGEGYYYIGLCLRLMDANKIYDALPYFAKSEKQGGAIALKAKAELETLYKFMHNNTLVGIEKIYRKAGELPD